ncbi:hypothetical protein L207DRAFT_640332 [Hyaloscypha variabilis F]|uniref:NAD(P)-binding protein n=1 Tax=Hyaloscypha variabilis (strain UAMH 11265 / GT02V1 / F) TaxID=1149755 RepID=A0A2J6R0F9_HYAVF|nr:hypothetical protein L207DRAFT_640332 [Hyaloscypha variabilis F]
MVKIEAIREANLQFASQDESGLICVFAGATSGIGLSTLLRLSTMLHSPTFYIIGRSASAFSPHHSKILSLNPTCKVAFLETEISLLSEVSNVCKTILSKEKKLDILYMSPGCMPLNGAQYTKENLETCLTLSYYTRLLLLTHLLPLLRFSPNPRVLSVLNAGKETELLETDLGLERDNSWSFTRVVGHSTTMTSLAFDFLAKEESNREITFIHAAPGLVKTRIFERVTPLDGSAWWWRLMLGGIKGMAAWLYWFKGVEAEESGERMVFLLTGGVFGKGAWRVDEWCEGVGRVDGGLVEGYVEKGEGVRVWEFTEGVFERVLGDA